MLRHLTILALLAAVVVLPFALRQRGETGSWREGDPVLVIMTPMNQAIRYEFGRAFSAWHQQHYGKPVKVDWLNAGGTTEISRYLASEYVAAFRAWWRAQGKPWPAGSSEALLNNQADAAVAAAFRATDDPQAFTSKCDLLFGGGEYDHTLAYRQGWTVPPWPAGKEPAELLAQVPEKIGGEVWRTPTMFGMCVSTFGICYNRDRLRDLGVKTPPRRWDDVADPVYVGQVAVADPTKSGSYAKAFEMIVQQKCAEAVLAAKPTRRNKPAIKEERSFPSYGSEMAVADPTKSGSCAKAFEMIVQQKCAEAMKTTLNEDAITEERSFLRYGSGVAVARGWVEGMRLVQRIGANARYFTDSSSKVPVDVAAGDAAVGLTIDFYARFQAQISGQGRMKYVTPVGGSSVSCDPVSLLRGAPHREVAVRFIEFALSREGQHLWCDDPHQPGSATHRYALARVPIRQDFYPSALPVDPYALAQTFTYRPEWTGKHFNAQRDLVRVMCLDAGDELRSAWRAIIKAGMPPRALAALGRLPVTWESAPLVVKQQDRLTYMREWTEFFRKSYREAEEMAEGKK